MTIKYLYLKDSIYPLKEAAGENAGTYDLSIVPIEDKWRSLVPKSDKVIRVGQTEETPFGTLKCQPKHISITQVVNPVTEESEKVSIERDLVSVGLYKDGKVIGLELLCEPTADELEKGIPEWRFDAQQTSTLGTAWDYSSTDIWFWTIQSLREKGTMELSKNLG